jgi:murein DD-endopeptidase MepM/ murein hydrolase activator NlpD
MVKSPEAVILLQYLLEGSGMKNGGCYTLLVIPQKKSSVRKVKVSSEFLVFLSSVLVISLLSIIYFSYDYIQLRGAEDELVALQELSVSQKKHIDALDAKVSELGNKMAELEELDEKIRVITNIGNKDNDGNFLGMGGPIPEEERMASKIVDAEQTAIRRVHESIDQLLQDADQQRESFKELLEFLTRQKSLLAMTPSIWPTRGWVTSEFGYRISPFTGRREIHRGIDIATRIKTEIVAPADGVISMVRKDPGMGNEIRINHGNKVVTVYGHLLQFAVKRGQRVQRGDLIGYVGNSGRSTGSHLHYGVMVDGVYVNPRKYLF